MKSRSLIVASAILLAVLATIAVFTYVSGVKAEAETAGEPVSIIVAKQDIPAGADLDDLISSGAFTSVFMPEDVLINGAITSLQQLEGRETVAAILRGEQIAPARLKGSGRELPGGILGIPEGQEAISLTLEEPQAAGGAVEAGDHVTVYATFDSRGPSGTAATVTLVPDAQILRVERPDVEGGDAAEVDAGIIVTLALAREDTQSVVFANEEGSIWFSLLAPGQPGLPGPAVTFNEVIK
jgi:pilus assembly protein CpaB